MQQCIRVQPHTANSEQTLIYKQQKLAAPLALQKIVSKPVGTGFSLTFVQKFWYNVGRSIGVWSIHVRSRVGQSICVGTALARKHSNNLESTLTFSRVGGWVGGGGTEGYFFSKCAYKYSGKWKMLLLYYIV